MTFRPRLAVALTVLALTALELTLRHGFNYPRAAVMELHGELGYQFVPNQDKLVARHEKDSDPFHISINSDGFRDHEWTDEDDHADVRVALFGDSLIVGVGANFEDTLTPLLEEHLQAALPARKVCVRNYAVNGYGIEQMARCYELRAREWRPHFVVFCATAYSSREMREVPGPVDHPLRRPILRLALNEWVYSTLLPWIRGGPVSRISFSDEAEREREEARVRRQRRLVGDPLGKGGRRLWSEAAARMRGLSEELSAASGRFALAAMPQYEDALARGEAPLPAFFRQLGEDLPGAILVDPWPLFRQRTQELLGRVQDSPRIPDSARLFLEADRRHFARGGHQALAESIAASLLDALDG